MGVTVDQAPKTRSSSPEAAPARLAENEAVAVAWRPARFSVRGEGRGRSSKPRAEPCYAENTPAGGPMSTRTRCTLPASERRRSCTGTCSVLDRSVLPP